MVDRSAEAGKTADLGDILLQDRGALKGVVLGPDNKPISGAKVYALDIPRVAFDFGLSGYEPEGLLVNQNSRWGFAAPLPVFVKKLEEKLPFGITKTSPDGSFSLKGLRKGLTSVLIVAKDLVRTIKTTTIRPGKTRDLGIITLREGQKLFGKVLDAEGKPLAGVLVSISPKTPIPISFGRKPKRTDPKGFFEFKGLGRGQHFILTKLNKDLPWKLDGPFRPGDKIEIRTEPTFARKVIVQTKGGEPVASPSFRLFLDLGGDVPPELFDMELKAAKHLKKGKSLGTWLLQGLPKGNYSLRVSAKPFAPAKVRVAMGKDWTSKPVLCRLLPGTSVSAIVQNRSGKPLPSARVYFRPTNRRGTILLGRTGRDGVLRIPLLPMNKGILIGRHPRYALGHTEIPIPVKGATYRIVLPKPGGVEGRILDSASPLKKRYTLFLDPRWKTRKPFGDLLLPRFTVSQLDGRFRIGGLQPGEYRLMPFVDIGKIASISQAMNLQREAFLLSRKRTKVLVPEGGIAQVTLDLAQTGTKKGTGRIHGFVRVDGRSGAGMEVALWGSATQRVKASANGSYQFSDLPKGHFRVMLIDGRNGIGETAIATRSVQLKDGEQKEVNFDIQLGTLEVQILDPKGRPYDGAQIILASKGINGSWITVHTNDQGRFRQRVPLGKWTLQLGWNEKKRAGFTLGEKTVEVRSPAPVRLTVRGIEDLVVQGTIRLDYSKVDQDWIEHARKRPPTKAYFQSNGSWWQISLKPDGGPSPLDGKKHPPGDYTVVAFGKGVSWRGKVKISPDHHLGLDIVLQPSKNFTLPKPSPKKQPKRGGDRKKN